jgi:hypothetical protein
MYLSVFMIKIKDKSKAEIADDDDVSVVARFSPHKSKSDKQLLIF